MKVTTQIKGRIEDIIASYESASNVRCISYATRDGWVTMEFKQIEPEPEPEPSGDKELLDMIRRAFDALSDNDALSRDKIADEVKRRVRNQRWGAYQDEE